MNGPSNIHIGGRRAYTLIEMIISMVLVSALMSSVWGIMSLYNSLLTAGRDQATQQQLVRSVFQLIDEDLNGVIVLSPRHPMVRDDEVSGQPFPSSPDIDVDSFAKEGTSGRPVQISLAGTSTALRLSVRRFVVPADEAPSEMDLLNELGGGSQFDQSQLPEGEAADVPEFQTVVYQLQAPGAADGLNSLASGLYRLQASTAEFQSLITQQSTAEKNMATDGVAVGRSTLEALLFPAADSLAEDSGASESEELDISFERIPEVVNCRFRYFDGQTWQDQWSADQNSSLPAAVRVSIDVVSSTDAMQLSSLNRPNPDAARFAAQTGESSLAADSALSDADTDAATAVVQAKRFERTILLDSVRSLISEMAVGEESLL